jgi:hypothetical protein
LANGRVAHNDFCPEPSSRDFLKRKKNVGAENLNLRPQNIDNNPIDLPLTGLAQ